MAPPSGTLGQCHSRAAQAEKGSEPGRGAGERGIQKGRGRGGVQGRDDRKDFPCCRRQSSVCLPPMESSPPCQLSNVPTVQSAGSEAPGDQCLVVSVSLTPGKVAAQQHSTPPGPCTGQASPPSALSPASPCQGQAGHQDVPGCFALTRAWRRGLPSAPPLGNQTQRLCGPLVQWLGELRPEKGNDLSEATQ